MRSFPSGFFEHFCPIFRIGQMAEGLDAVFAFHAYK